MTNGNGQVDERGRGTADDGILWSANLRRVVERVGVHDELMKAGGAAVYPRVSSDPRRAISVDSGYNKRGRHAPAARDVSGRSGSGPAEGRVACWSAEGGAAML